MYPANPQTKYSKTTLGEDMEQIRSIFKKDKFVF